MSSGIVGLRAILAVLLLYVVLAPGFRAFGLYHWHDSQRALQLVALSATGLVLLGSAASRAAVTVAASCFFPGRMAWLAAAASVIGVVSVATAVAPRFAILELALLGMLFLSSVCVAALRLHDGCHADRILLLGIACAAAVLAVPFLVAWTAAMTSGVGLRSALLYQSGFSNVRFMGQFHTLALPLLACAVLLPGVRRGYRWLLFMLLAMTWVMAIGTATRATWLAWTLGTLAVLPFAGRVLLPLLRVQAAAMAAAMIMSWLMLELLPRFAAGGIAHASGLASVFGRFSDPLALSMRDILWVRALEVTAANPWLGIGPMMLALDHNTVAAHPHNAILQLSAEWGLPMTGLICALVAGLAWRLLMALRRICTANEPATAEPEPGQAMLSFLAVALSCSMAGAAVHSMVDGLLVMPHAQVTCALVAGWMVGLLVRHDPGIETRAVDKTAAERVSRPIHALIAGWSLFALGAFAAGALPEALDLDAREHAYFEKYFGEPPRKPRLWAQGWLFEDVPAELPLERRPTRY